MKSLDLTQVDLPTRLPVAYAGGIEVETSTDPLLAVVVAPALANRGASEWVRALFAGPFAGQLRDHGLHPISCASDEAVLRGGRFRAILLTGGTPDDVLPLLARLRGQCSTALHPILLALGGAAEKTHRLLSPTWRLYADAVLEGEAALWQPAPALLRLRQIDARGWPLESLDDRFSESARRQLTMLRWLTTRDLPAFEPVRDPSSPAAWAWPPFDLTGDPTPDLDALCRLGLLERRVADRACLCPGCGDARLLFREVCGNCRAPAVERGDVVHHYACGHVQAEAAFHRAGTLVCPSCSRPLRHVGIDYERPASLLSCHDCGHTAADGLTEARCLGCGATPLAGEVRERAIFTYVLTTGGLEAAQRGELPARPDREA